MYCLGYIFDPTKQEITRTGLIHLSSIPQGADIYLEKSHYQEKTPASIEGLIPGDYKVILKKKGYKLWTQQVSVKSARASAFENIILIPKIWAIKRILSEKFVKLWPLRGTDYFLISSTDNLGSFEVYECREGEIAPLLPLDSEFLDLPVVSIFTQEDSPIFIIYGGSLWNRKFLYVNLAKTPYEILDISKLIQEKPLDIESMSVSPHYLENIKGYGVHDRWIYTLDDKNNIFRQTFDKAEKKPVFGNAQFGATVFSESDFYKIKVLQSNIFLFLSQKGELLTNYFPYSLIEKGVEGLQLHKANLKLLYWTKQSIGLIDFSDVIESNILYTGRNITDCFWVIEPTHVLFNDKERLYLCEIEPQGEPHIEFITEIEDNSSFFYCDKTGSVYFLEPQSRNLNSIKIIQR